MGFQAINEKWEYVHTEQHPTEENEWHAVIQMPDYAVSIVNTKCVSKEEIASKVRAMAKTPEMIKELKENLKFLEWIEEQRFSMWSDKMQLLYQRIEDTKRLIQKATN